MITKEFEKSILGDIFQGTSLVPSTLYIGLCSNETIYQDMPLSEIVEVTGTGYSRQALLRGNADWSNPSEQSDSYSIESAIKTFTASGSDWTPFSRMFLTDAASGTTGSLFAVSTALPSPVTLADGTSFPTTFKLFLK